MASPFVKDEDKNEFENNSVELEKSISIFLIEITKYFNKVWNQKYYITDKINSLEELNEKYLHNYPSYAGYNILDDSFTGPDCPIDIISDTSKQILSYFYNIQLHSI